MTALILALLEDHDNSLQVKACLESSGHEVFLVEDFTTAKERFNLHKFDLIISDVHLQNGGDVFDFYAGSKGMIIHARFPSFF